MKVGGFKVSKSEAADRLKEIFVLNWKNVE